MIVSASHQFFIVAAPKSGSTSVTKAMQHVLQVQPKPRGSSAKGPVWHVAGMLHSQYTRECNRAILEANPDWTRAATCRNPWWRMISIYYQVALDSQGGLPRVPVEYPGEMFRECVLRIRDRPGKARRLWGGLSPLTPQHSWLDGCTRLFRFERLEEDYIQFCRDHNVESIVKLPWVMKPDYRGDRPWQEWYDKETSDAVGDFWGRDAELYGYEAPL